MTMTQSRPVTWHVYLLALAWCDTLPKSRQGVRDNYVGITPYPQRRLTDHNEGRVRSTSGRQWILLGSIPCRDRRTAAALEAYLKSGNTRQKRNQVLGLMRRSEEDREQGLRIITDAALRWQAHRNLDRSFDGATAQEPGNGNE